MDNAPEQRQRAEAPSNEAGAWASVHLTRFTIHPERRAELVDRAPSRASSAAGHLRSDWQLLVELEDGDWLDISITSPGQGSDDASGYLDLADGILGDEDGEIVGCALVQTIASASARREGPHGQPGTD
ncbi:MAG: hypothetical protein ACRDYE_16360 [Acidimicrobiales bacterium]